MNLVVITLDTVRADALGAYGQPRPTSPEIDRLAREGVLFEQVSTSQPETLPSHSTIFTGKWPFAHGVRANGGFVLSDRNVTLAERLRDAGYVTAAEVAAMVLRKETQVTQGFEHYRGPDSPNVEHKTLRYKQGPTKSQTEPVRPASDVTARGIEFVRENRDRSFFLWVHYFDAHAPYSPLPIFNHKIRDSPYHAEIAGADFQVGRLILEVERLGLRDDTLVVVTADHGEGLGDHGEVSHSYFVYESTVRVPLIFWGPRTLPSGLRIATPVRTVDIAPTVLELLGMPPLGEAQGVSLAKLIAGSEREAPGFGYGEATRLTATFSLPPLRFIRDGALKYIHKVNPELYDLDVDPGELVNLAPSRPEDVARLRAALGALLAAAPEKPTDAQAEIDAETAAQLIALGYVARSPLIEVVDDVESLALDASQGDPMDRIPDVVGLTEANGFLARNMYGPALERLAPIVEKNPDSAYLLELAASALLGLGREDEAIDMLRHAVALDRHDTEAAQSLAAALATRGREAEAVEILAGILRTNACDESARMNLGIHLRKLKRYRELVATMAEGARACPDMLSNLNNYAWALATLPTTRCATMRAPPRSSSP